MCLCVCERARIVHALRKYIGTAIKCIYNVLCICSCDVFVQFCISTPMKACIEVCMQATSKAEHADFGARPSSFRRRHIFGISICRTISVSVYQHPCICRTISVYRTCSLERVEKNLITFTGNGRLGFAAAVSKPFCRRRVCRVTTRKTHRCCRCADMLCPANCER